MQPHKVIVLKTDIQSEQMLRLLFPIFDNHTAIHKWSVDLEDCDKVLRIESHPELCQMELLALIKAKGFNAEELND
ncbi:MAG: hypothetical protein ACJASM_000699 [Salibacteraceae bacterium]|jgi:hypothetical protein|tara:strand:+ start:254 stop:481 length:228 start_codon:yes stop_codon:yes gene_type:complete